MTSSFYDVNASATYRQSFYKALFTYAPVGIAILDGKGKITAANVVCCTLLKYNSSELIDCKLDSFAQREDVRVIQKAVERMSGEENGSVANLLIRFIPKNGPAILTQMVLLPVRDERSQMVNVMAYLTPLLDSERKENLECENAIYHPKIQIWDVVSNNWQWALSAVGAILVTAAGFYVKFEMMADRQVRQEQQIEKLLQVIEKIDGAKKAP